MANIKMKKKLIAVLCASMALSLAACGSKTAPTETTETETEMKIETETQALTETETKETEDPALGKDEMYSYLTGEVVSKDVGLKRPYAIMLNNIQDALPQSGILYAEVVYEAQVEAGITRLMGVFQDVDDVEKIGSIRSARHYYIDFANDNEAVYVHFGQSRFAQDRFDNEGITTISGLSSYTYDVFYRSDDREAPHNVYTTGDMLATGLDIVGLSRDYPEDYTPRLKFNRKDTPLKDGIDASVVNIPFDSQPWFEYDEETGLYKRFQYGEPHIDRETEEQLAYKNVIVQYVYETSISNEDHQDLTLNGTGQGYYITDGKAIEITWKRADNDDRTKYYDADGNEIRLNPGKTFFEVVSDSKTVTFE